MHVKVREAIHVLVCKESAQGFIKLDLPTLKPYSLRYYYTFLQQIPRRCHTGMSRENEPKTTTTTTKLRQQTAQRINIHYTNKT